MFGLEARLLGILGLAAAALLALKLHDRGVRLQCERDHQVAAAAELEQHTEAIGSIANETQRLQNRAAADRRTLDAAAVGLRGAIAGSGLIVRAAAAGASSPAADAAGVCAELLDQADRRLRILAATADERGIAGDSCVQSYEALRQ